VTVPTSDTPTTIEIAPQSGVIVEMSPGHRIRIVDVEGSQVADLFAVLAEDLTEWLSPSATRVVSGRLFPAVGESFVSTAYRPLLTFERDDSPGVHDMLASPCSAEMYSVLGYQGYHPSCSENFRIAAAAVDWHPLHIPDPVNLFQRTPVGPDGSLAALPALTRPGDSVTLRAEAPIYVIVTACAMDLEPINGDRCTSLGLEISP
jgi:uncharacterized protein YcgI (DUF1989 family)